jgi:PAS domain S-box-containing protein
MNFALGLTHKGIILVLVPLLFGLTSVAVLEQMLSQTELDLTNSYKQRELTSKIETLVREFSDAGFALGGYAQTGNAWFKDRYTSLSDKTKNDLNSVDLSLKELGIVGRVSNFDSKVQDGLAAFDAERDGLENENQFLRQYTSADTYRKVRLAADDVQAASAALQSVGKIDVQESARQRLRTYTTLFSVFNVLLTLLLAFFFSRSIVKRIHRVTENSLRLASGQELQPVIMGRDEIADLDRIFHEVSEQLTEMIHRERAIVENAVDVICSISAEGRFLSVSPSVESWGYKAEELIGNRFILLLAADERETKLKSLNAAIESATPISMDCSIVRKDDSRIATNWSISWSAREQAIFCVVHDISEQRALEKLRDEFVTMVTHDLRTPLSCVQVFHEMLSNSMLGNLNAEGARSLTLADTSMRRVLDLVNDLLDYEKIQAGEMQLDLSEVELVSLVQESIDAVSPFADKHQVAIQFEHNGQEPISGDKERLVRVMVNLLSNAIKFSPSLQAVSVTMENSPDAVTVKIIDCGPGVPPQDQSTIFEKYKQTSVRSVHKMKSTGLGLPICKAIINAHHGEIGVHSELGKGSIFWFRVPRHVSEPASAGTLAES